MNENEFGFLQKPLRASFLGVSFAPLDDHAEKLAAIKKDSNKDGFYYPPQIVEYSIDLITNKIKNKVEQSEKPATVYPFISSHRIKIENPVSTLGEPSTDEAVIIYLLAFIYGTRLQPSKWKFEGRIPIKPQHNIYITDDTCLHFLEHVYGWWRKQSVGQRQKFVNILYVYTRASSLEWDWDMFVHQYMVFDALYNLHLEFKPKLKAKTHKKRFELLCKEYSIFNHEYVEEIYAARNGLFHEAMWVGNSTIGFGSEGHQLPHNLARLNARIICSLTGYNNDYARSVWWAMGCFGFDKC